MKSQIINYIRAGYPGIYLVSCEEARVEAEMKTIAESVNYKLFAWSVVGGLVDTKDGHVRQAQDPVQALEAIGELPENTLVLLKDFHQFLEEGNPVLVRQVKEALRVGKTRGKVLIVLGCRFALPPELARELVTVEFALPEKEQLGVVLDNIASSAKVTKPEGDEREELLDAACGLTSIEAENAFALSVVESGRLSSGIVAREKASEVKKGGLLEICSLAASPRRHWRSGRAQGLAGATARRLWTRGQSLRSAQPQGTADCRHSRHRQVANRQSHSQRVSEAAAQAGCWPLVRGAGWAIRV